MSTAIALRPDQEVDLARVREAYSGGAKSVLLVRGTGTGKTFLFSKIARGVTQRAKRVVAIAHRDELITQISETFSKWDVRHGIIGAGMTYDRRLLAHVASVDTLIRRLELVEVPDVAIVDESHHCVAKTKWGKVLAYWKAKNPNLLILGVTATPIRLSGEGLGEIFEVMVVGLETAEAIELGVLCKYRLIAPPGNSHAFDGIKLVGGELNQKAVGDVFRDKPSIIGDGVAHYRKFLDGAPSIAFCPSIEIAEQTAQRFRDAGFSSASIDGKMEMQLRRQIVRDFGAGLINVMPSVSLIDEGFDCPGIIGMMDFSPSESLGRVLQRWGRTLRTFKGKESAILVDHVGNTGKIINGEFVSKHGLPDDKREWSLEGVKKKKGATAPSACRQCPACYAVSPISASKCRECGKEFPTVARVVEEVAGELSEIELAKIKRAAVIQQAQAKTLDELREVARQRGYKPAWADHIFASRQKKEAARR